MKPFVLRDAALVAKFKEELDKEWPQAALDGKPLTVSVKEPSRTEAQNAAMWPVLRSWAQHKKWCVNGELQYLNEWEWKDILTAAFLQETVRMAEGLNGGLVMLGAKTHKFSGKRFSEFLQFLISTSIEHEIPLAEEPPWRNI